jgi:acylglycerol lipase
MKHKEGNFKGLKDFNIYFQCWLPEESARAVILVAHGYGEHSGRYQNLVDHFLPRGYAVYALDHRGHGRSDGERVQVDHFSDYLTDLKTFFDLVQRESLGQKIFLLGHSMGAGISTAYAVQHQQELAGLILSGGGITPNTGAAAPAAAPRTGAGDLASTLSRDPAVVEAYRNDPLVYHGPPPDRRASAMSSMRSQLPDQVPGITLPILIMAGSASPLGDGPRSQALYDAVGSRDKTLKLYEGLMHEIFNEPEHPQVMADLEAWLEAHV